MSMPGLGQTSASSGSLSHISIRHHPPRNFCVHGVGTRSGRALRPIPMPPIHAAQTGFAGKYGRSSRLDRIAFVDATCFPVHAPSGLWLSVSPTCATGVGPKRASGSLPWYAEWTGSASMLDIRGTGSEAGAPTQRSPRTKRNTCLINIKYKNIVGNNPGSCIEFGRGGPRGDRQCHLIRGEGHVNHRGLPRLLSQ